MSKTKYTERSEQIKKILEEHLKWIKNEPGGKRADLRGINLSGLDLRGFDLSGADLRYLDLSGLDLRGLKLRGALLRNTDLSDSDLRGLDLSGFDLHGVLSNTLKPENLGLEHETNTDLLRSIAKQVVKGNCNMDSWHLCETTHCLAGWSVHLSGPIGYALEATTSPSVAGCVLVPEISHLFFKGNKEAEDWAEEFLENDAA